LFKSNGNYFGNEWDGTYNGDPLPFAVYYYTIDPVNENGTTYNGGITIKR
jgi:gliding motility-associated-like protein